METKSMQEALIGSTSKVPDNMTFIQACPWDFYFVWQVEVNIVNFRKHNISDKMHVCVWFPDSSEVKLKPWFNLQNKYSEVRFFFYKDTGVNLGLYIPQLRPHILAKHFDNFPELINEVIFYHDSDIIFNYLPDFRELETGPVNYQSDTSGYLDYQYLRSKEMQGNIPEDEAIRILCGIGNVSLDLFKSYEGKTGGAQYILKGVDGDFWRDVERQCIEIRRAFTYGQPQSINTRYFFSEAAGFQSWCADMWAVNMALWARSKITDVTPQLDFSWATDNNETYKRKPIYHNAGATGTQPGVFFKGHFINKSPIGKRHAVKNDSASWYYVRAIEEVK